MSGRFVWYDLRTDDIEASWAFYQAVVGYGREKFGGSPYEMLVSAKGAIGGIEALSDADRARGGPYWLAYVNVADVDATTARVEGLGGTVLAEPEDIPGVGRFSILQDPTGAVVGAFTQRDPSWKPDAEVVRGAVVWHECYAGLEGAWSFYSELFGWEVAQTMDMGPGEYRMYKAKGDDLMLGGMMDRPPIVPAPTWVYYLHVDEISAGAAAVKANGGTVLEGPMEIPGGEYTAVCLDPQGAIFALHSKVNSAA